MSEKKKDRPEYEESEAARQAAEALGIAESSVPSAYASQYAGAIADAASRILSGEKFSYDFNTDPIYNVWRERAVRDSKRAAENAAASAAALTGGYANSYGTTAAAQAASGELSKVSDIIPSLFDAAYKRWQGEREADREKLRALMELENADYGRYRDSVSDAESQRDYLLRKYSELSSADRDLYEAALGAYFSDRDYDRRVYEYDRNDAYRRERDAADDAYREKEYALNYMKALAAANSAAAKAAEKETEKETSAKAASAEAKAIERDIANGNYDAAGGLSPELVERLKKAKRDGAISSAEYEKLMDYVRRTGVAE